MEKLIQISNFVGCLLLIFVFIAPSNALYKRPIRSPLPSVSDDHYQELSSDGTYKYAYTGENRYTAERRLSDGTVEGETLYVRPDGVPVKVHYFADARGYRPKTEVLYSERVGCSGCRTVGRSKVIVPDVIYKEVDAPEHRTVVLAAPPPAPHHYAVPVPVPVPVAVPVSVPVAVPYAVPKSDDSSINVRLEGSQIILGDSHGRDTAIANPSVTAIVGPGGHAELRPQGIATTRSGGTAIANPSTTAVVGPGGSVVLAPSARASTVDHDHNHDHDTIVTSVRGSRYHSGERVLLHEVVPAVPAVHTVVLPPPPQVAVRTVVPHPHLTAVETSGVLIVPPRPSYSYEYSYSAPDGKHPGAGDNRAHVAVRVNQ